MIRRLDPTIIVADGGSGVAIEVPPKQGAVLTVVFTYEGDFRSYFPYDDRVELPFGIGEGTRWGFTELEYVERVSKFLSGAMLGDFLELPQQARPGWYVYLPWKHLTDNLKHVHKAWTDSPLAQQQRGGEKIVVAQFAPGHGPGKRGRN